jgi:riboflavin synthase
MGGSTCAAGPETARPAVPAHPRIPLRSPEPAADRSAPEENEVGAVFTGIVEELGEVVAVEQLPDAARLTVRGPKVSADALRGDSIAINGVCLTVINTSDGTFTADVMGETLARSGLGGLSPGAALNLERPLRLDDRLGGHLVQGHADGTGTIVERRPGTNWDVLRIAVPEELIRYVALKGSIAVDGVSLTVSATGPFHDPVRSGPDSAPGFTGSWSPASPEAAAAAPWFEVSLIPETLQCTTLGTKQAGQRVNLEVDVIAKYVEKLLEGKSRA